APGPRISSANFQLRHDRGETGVSVTRLGITGPARLLELVGGSAEQGSRVASAGVGAVRALGLRVEPKPLPDDPGHAEIQSDRSTGRSGDFASSFSVTPKGHATFLFHWLK